MQRIPSGFATPDSNSPCSSYIGGDYLVTRRKSSADAKLKEDDKSNNSVTSEEISKSWVEQDKPGVYLTMITVPGVGKQLKRVRFWLAPCFLLVCACSLAFSVSFPVLILCKSYNIFFYTCLGPFRVGCH